MSLEEVWERIEALARDIEQLGVDVRYDVSGRYPSWRPRLSLILTAINGRDLEEEPRVEDERCG